MDREFNSFRDLLFGQKIDPSSSGSNAVPLGKRNINASAPTLQSDPSNVDDENTSGPAPADDELDYDQTVRQLAFDKRAKPTDRTKTEEELAAEEAAKLEKAERARLRRMRGEADDLDDESDGRSRGAKRRRADADDLDDDFDLDDGFGLGKGLGDADVDVDAELSSKESASDTSASSDEGSESGDDDDGSSDGLGASADEALVDGDVEELIAPSSSKSRRKSTGSTGELPYTFPCPSTHSEFLDITDGIKPSDLPIVVQRIRTIYHPSLGEANKEKLMVRY
jgi:nucleolar protein 14